MANPAYESAIDDPTPAEDRQQILTKPLPTPSPHPMVQFADRLVAPLYGQQNIGDVPRAAPPMYPPQPGPIGPTGPMGPAYPSYPTEHYNRTPAEQDAYANANREQAARAYAAYQAQKRSGAVGPTGPQTPPGYSQEPALGPDPYAYDQNAGFLGQQQRTIPGREEQRTDAPNVVSEAWKSLTGEDAPWNQPLNPGAPGHILDQVPVLGGIANTIGTQFRNAPFGEHGVVALEGAYRDARAKYGKDSPEAKQALENWGTAAVMVAAGTGGQNIRGVGEKPSPLGPLGKRIIARSPLQEAAGGPAAAAAQEAAAAVRGPIEPGTGGALKAGTMAAAEAKAAEGAAPRYVVETGKTRSIIRDSTTGEALPFSFTKPESAQFKADQLNTPTSAANPFSSPEAQMTGALRTVTRVKANPEDSVADLVRRAARAAGPDLTGEAVAAGPLRPFLNNALRTAKLEATDANAVALGDQLIAQERARPSVGNLNAQKVTEAVTGSDVLDKVMPAEGAPPLALPEHNMPGDELDQAFGAPFEPAGTAGAGGGGPKLPGASGASTSGLGPEPRLPPPPPSRNMAKTVALGTLDALTDLPRALMLTGHLPYLRQALPMMFSAIVRGEPQEIALAVWRPIRAAINTDAGRVAMDDSFRKSLLDEGMPEANVSRLLTSQHGALSAREDFTMTSWLGKLPVLKNINAAYPTVMNSLRVGMALERARMAKAAGQAVDWNRITDQVRHLSGRGELPGEGNPAVAVLWNKAFFGPRLMSSAWQTAGDTIIAMRGVAGDIGRRPLDVNDLAQIRDVAAYVLGGLTIMQMMQHAGYEVETDPDSRDWGRIVNHDTGDRIDLWGQFGPDARLIARTLNWLNVTHLGWGTPQRPQKYGAQNAVDMVEDYFRGKAGPGLSSLALDTLYGKDITGKPFILNQLPGQIAADPMSHIPLPLAAGALHEGASSGEAGLVSAGAGVMTSPRHINYDGLGAAPTEPTYQQGSILEKYAQMAEASKNLPTKWHGGDPVMAAPPTTIGTGANEIQLDPKTAARYVKALGTARDAALGPLVNSPEFQNAGLTKQQTMFDDAVKKADHTASEQFLAHEVTSGTDPKMIAAEGLQGFLDQSSLKDRAYWVNLLDRVGKLTPDVTKAINDYELAHAKDEGRPPLTVDEYRRAGPIVHTYLSHVPYGTDAHPIGTPADWAAVDQARKDRADREDQLIRGGVNPVIAKRTSEVEIGRTLSAVQRGLFLQGALAENPARRLMAATYGSMLTRFLGVDPQYIREADAAYTNFPYSR